MNVEWPKFALISVPINIREIRYAEIKNLFTSFVSM